MSSMHGHRGARRAQGGCPPMLTVDLTHTDLPTDAVGTAVEWPPAPPTRRSARHRTRRAEPDVGELTTQRAIHLLDAALAHLRTALETREPDADPTMEEAVAAIADARDALLGLEG